MDHYIRPRYKIKEDENGIYKIWVTITKSSTPPHNIAQARTQLLKRQAQRDPLLATALIHQLAAYGDIQAKELSSIYKAYCSFMTHRDTHAFKKACVPKSDPLVRQCASALALALAGKAISPSLKPAWRLLNTLIPSLAETLTSPVPILLHPPKKIQAARSKASHHAFPDIVKHQGHHYICYREGQAHVKHRDLGKIRILKGSYSTKQKKWTWSPHALIEKEQIDLRDPRFFFDGKGRLHLIMGGSTIDKKDKTAWMSPHVATLANGKWKLEEAVADPSCNGVHGQWIWRVMWNPFDDCGYALSYGSKKGVYLVKTSDGKNYKKVTLIKCPPLTELTEGTLRFTPDAKAIAFIRARRKGIIAKASAKTGYRKWSCKVIPFRVGGPNFLLKVIPFRVGGPNFLLNEGEAMWAGTRYFFLHEDNVTDESTIVAMMDEERLVPLLRLPSSNDCSYPGMLLEEDGTLTFTYYSSPDPSHTEILITKIGVSKDRGQACKFAS